MAGEIKRFRVGVIGYGYWGPIVARNFHAHPDMTVAVICDRHQVHLEKAALLDPKIRTTMEASEILESSEIDAVVIATQAGTHYALTREALENGKHVFVEKPLTLKISEAEELVALAEEKKRLLFVDHTFLFTPAFERLKSMVRAGDLGNLRYYYSLRTGFGLVGRGADIHWHLLYHDVYVVLALLEKMPRSVCASGHVPIVSKVTDMGTLILDFEGGFSAHMHANSVFPKKCRDIVLAGEKKMVVWDDTRGSQEKLSLVSKTAHWDFETSRVVHTDGGEKFLPVPDEEALAREVECFFKSLATCRDSSRSARMAIDVLRILTAADASLEQNGAAVSV